MHKRKATSWLASRIAVGLAIGGGVAIAPPTLAQITPDNTLPTPSSVEVGCTSCVIEGGTRQDQNLFHSFTEFSVPTGGEAIFNHAADVENIFSRVTGRAVSDIDGLIQTQGTTNLFLLNPNGILFGPNAQLDIGGSFTASAADSLIFTNGETFSATSPTAPPLLTISTNLGLQEGIAQGAKAPLINQGNLSVGKDLTLMAGELDIRGQLDAGNALRLVANSDIVIEGILSVSTEIADAGDVSLLAGGDITLADGSQILADGLSGGDILLQSNETITVTNSAINSESTATTPSAKRGSLSLLADSIRLEGEDTIVSAGTTGVREGSSLLIQADDVITIDSSLVRSRSTETATGSTGDVNITANQLHILGGGSVSVLTLVTGDAGDINVTATDSVTLDGARPTSIAVAGDRQTILVPSSLFVSSLSVEAPRALGNLSIKTSELTVINGALLANSATGTGDSGDVIIESNKIFFDGIRAEADQFRPTAIFTTAREGNGGNIHITGHTLTLTGGATFIASVEDSGTGAAGNVVLNLTDAVTIAGGSAFAPTAIFTTARPGARGDGGDISITTRDFSLLDSAQLRADTAALGQGGNITVDSQTFTMRRGLLTTASRAQGEGDAGNIVVTASTMSLEDGSLLLAETTSSQGGDIELTIQDLLLLRNSSVISTRAGIAQAGGDGGNITINAPTGFVIAVPEENSDIVADAFEGRGGNIAIAAQSLLGIGPTEQPTPLSDIRASSELGLDGTVAVYFNLVDS